MIETDTPRISLVLVDGLYRERFDSINFFGRQTIPHEDYELTWVEYYDHVRPELAEKIARYPNFRVITLNRTGLYHASVCFNAGIRASRGELIVIPDADVLVEPEFLETVWREHQTCDRMMMYIYRYNEAREDHLPVLDMDHLRRVAKNTNPRNHGGCLTVRKKWLYAINGYDEHPIFGTGEHLNGSDVYLRFRALGLHEMWHPTLKLYHRWHARPAEAGVGYDTLDGQRVVTTYRAQNLITLPFQGLDPARNTDMPPEIAAAIEETKRRTATRPSTRPSGFVRRAVRRLRQLLQEKM